jgi:hypothetical protein
VHPDESFLAYLPIGLRVAQLKIFPREYLIADRSIEIALVKMICEHVPRAGRPVGNALINTI